jgi:hypothetical protein
MSSSNILKPLSDQHIKVIIIRELIELFNDDVTCYTIAQHLMHLMRAKGAKGTYEWNNNDFLVKLQEYKEEICDCVEEEAELNVTDL